MKAESSKVTLCEDGVYRWYYEFPMMKNPTILFTIWKVLLIASCAPALVSMIAVFTDGRFLEGLKTFAEVLGVTFGIMLVLSLIAYFILGLIYGFKYIVLFEMNEEGVVHIQQPKQFKKAQAIGWLTAIAGSGAANPTVTGAGLLAASKQYSSSEFEKVDRVIGHKRFNTIKVNQWFSKNQVYVTDEDYDFVWDYITKRCTKAKIK